MIKYRLKCNHVYLFNIKNGIDGTDNSWDKSKYLSFSLKSVGFYINSIKYILNV